MIVSWDWLADYVTLDMTPEQLTHRLAMAGLNHESTTSIGQDLAIDIEVTSNRPDCLGHIGIAREVAVLWHRDCLIPDPRPQAGSTRAGDLIRVTIECPELCPRYTARVVRGVKLGASPAWMQSRLATIGIASINNIVDITNYVMMECGQPLHAFDLACLQGQQIIVRRARSKEPFLAIDHRTYELTDQMCVIADQRHPVAIGGVMGGADSEVSASTRDILIEAAEFDPLTVRNTARWLRLFSPSSYRFERSIDPQGVDWASRRCAELILELAGGELAEGVVDEVAVPTPPRALVVLRLSQLERILGIDIPQAEVCRILTALGNELLAQDALGVTVRPPSWRRDLTREIDMVEEVARIHGYDEIREDVGVRMTASARTRQDRIFARTRTVLCAAGFDEAMTPSVVTEQMSEAMSCWTEAPAIHTLTPMLRGASYLRRSLLPSLLAARQLNESLQNPEIELFELAKIYLPQPSGLPHEPYMLALVSQRELLEVKGVLRALLHEINHELPLESEDADEWLRQLCGDHCCRLMWEGQWFGILGQLNDAGKKQFELRQTATFAELRMELLVEAAQLVPQYAAESVFPAIRRDLNLIVDEHVRWDSLSKTVSQACGGLLDSLDFREIFRDTSKDGADKKRLVFSFNLRAQDRTLTREEADEVSSRVVQACSQQYGAVLLG